MRAKRATTGRAKTGAVGCYKALDAKLDALAAKVELLAKAVADGQPKAKDSAGTVMTAPPRKFNLPVLPYLRNMMKTSS